MRNIIITLIAIILLSSQTQAVEFRVELWPYGPEGMGLCAKDTELRLYMNNNDTQRNGYSIPFEISGIGMENFEWLDAGAPSPEGGHLGGCLEILNGFAPGDYSTARFTALNAITADSWDGNLPDTMNHTTAQAGPSAPGWSADEGELLVYKWHFNVRDYSFSLDRTLCIDSIAHSIPPLDWLWSPASGPFGGPYCFEFTPACPPTEIVNCPESEIVVNVGRQVSLTFEIDQTCGHPLNEIEPSMGNAVITGEQQFTWTFEPTYQDTGYHNVEICAIFSAQSCPTPDNCQFTLYVSKLPICADIDGNDEVNLLDILYMIDHIYGTPQGPGPVNPEYGDLDNSGNMDLLDILYLIDVLYGELPSEPPQCP